MNIVDFFDNRRYWEEKRNKFLNSIYFYALWNRIVVVAANIILPVYFKLTANNKKYALKNTDKKENRYIVSLTSFPTRIPRLWLVVESILRQNIKPDKIVLYLQVSSEDLLPKNLLALKKRGVEIELCDSSLRSHNKYYHAFKNYHKDNIITIDDDIFYRSDFIENLIDWNKKYPKCIICNWAKIVSSETELYRNWRQVAESSISKFYLPIGVAGVLYPTNCMYKDIFNQELIKSCTLSADDIFLTCMALLNGTEKFFTGYKQHFLEVIINRNIKLSTENISQNKNQKCVDNLNKYYQERLGIRPFIDLIND